MKTFRFYETGGPEVLRFEDVEVPNPGPGEIRIRHEAIAVNFRDVLVRRGQHAIKSFPSGLGLESAGMVDAIGAEATVAFDRDDSFGRRCERSAQQARGGNRGNSPTLHSARCPRTRPAQIPGPIYRGRFGSKMTTIV